MVQISDRHLCVQEICDRDLNGSVLKGHGDGCSDESWVSVLKEGKAASLRVPKIKIKLGIRDSWCPAGVEDSPFLLVRSSPLQRYNWS